jgi:hypothetical protein
MTSAVYLIIFCLIAFLTGCEVQSGITKKSLEKYEATPTPAVNLPTPEPIDPADVVVVDTSLDGPRISVNKIDAKKPFNCDKYNRLTLNVDGGTIEIRGTCRQIMVNGDQNKITVEAASEIVLNGHENEITYSKIINSVRPIIDDNGSANTATKVAASVDHSIKKRISDPVAANVRK